MQIGNMAKKRALSTKPTRDVAAKRRTYRSDLTIAEWRVIRLFRGCSNILWGDAIVAGERVDWHTSPPSTTGYDDLTVGSTRGAFWL
jgi:hypothetical protein